jgi:hypothetical protein
VRVRVRFRVRVKVEVGEFYSHLSRPSHVTKNWLPLFFLRNFLWKGLGLGFRVRGNG